MIIDDSDGGKSGMRREVIGRMWCDVDEKRMVGYKCVRMMLWDGVREVFVDLCVDGEEGKEKEKVEGVSGKEGKGGYREEEEGERVKEGVDEYVMKKREKGIDMVKYGMKGGVGFD